jgi:hypothetical protein
VFYERNGKNCHTFYYLVTKNVIKLSIHLFWSLSLLFHPHRPPPRLEPELHHPLASDHHPIQLETSPAPMLHRTRLKLAPLSALETGVESREERGGEGGSCPVRLRARRRVFPGTGPMFLGFKKKSPNSGKTVRGNPWFLLPPCGDGTLGFSVAC